MSGFQSCRTRVSRGASPTRRPWCAGADSRSWRRSSNSFAPRYRTRAASVADPWHFGEDPDPGFRHWPSRCKQKTNFLTQFFCLLFLKVHLHHFSKIKSHKESQNSRNQGFSYYFCMMIEGSGSGTIPLTSGSGSGSGKPKNMWIRIRNTAGSMILV